MMNEREDAFDSSFIAHRSSSLNCPACGAASQRVEARFCSTCGRALEGGYHPADALRASYHKERHGARQRASNFSTRRARPSLASFPMQNRNNASTTALAFVTYALVPYLGILFCPGALLMGSLALFNSYRAPQLGGRRASYTSILLGLLILCAQLLLWWILYKVPQWTR